MVIDVPLTGMVSNDDQGRDDAPDPPNWRRAIGIALVAGVVIGVGISVVRLQADDDASTSGSTIPAEELATVITTPPTLAPVSALPPPDFETGETAPPTLPPGVTRPVYEAVPDAGPDDPALFELAAAITRLDEDLPRRSETHVELGVGGYVLDVTIDRDPVRDRYRLVLESRGVTQVAIVDVASGVTYVNPDTDDQAEILTADIIAGSPAVDANDYFDRLLLGPLRSDTYDTSSTRGRGFVTIDGVGLAREFATGVRGELIPEWQIYAFGPVLEFRPEDRPSVLEYAAYVTEDGRVAQVDGVSSLGVVSQLVEHRLTLLDDAPIVELPTPPAASLAPSSTPATTP